MNDTYEDLLAKITHHKKRLFLQEYPKFKVSKHTAEAIGIGDSTVRAWYHDETFLSALTALKKEVEQHIIQLHEQNIDDVALDPKTKDQSRIFGSLVRLRAAWPEKYREQTMKHVIEGDIIFKIKAPEPDYLEVKEVKLLGEGNAPE